MKIDFKDYLLSSKDIQPLPTCIESSGRKLHNIRAVIFDIYGTLLVSGSGDVGTAMESGSTEAFKKTLNQCGIFQVPDSAAKFIRDYFYDLISKTHSQMRKAGYPHPEINIIEIWSQIINSPEMSGVLPAFSSVSPEHAAFIFETIVNPVFPMPGASKLLKKLKDAGIKLGIVSNAQFYTPIIFEHFFPGGFEGFGFEKNICLFSYIEKRSKPDIFLFKKLSDSLSEHGILPAESVFIGNDMLKDIFPSASAGFKTVLFAGDKRSLRLRSDNPACSNLNPDVIVSKLTDLIDYIQEG